jgi:hypothetical protein
MTIWFIFHHLGMFHQEKSGNPGMQGEASLEWKKMLVHKHDAFNRALLRKCPDWRGAWPGSFAFV